MLFVRQKNQMLFDLSDVVEQLLEDTRHSWEYTLNSPAGALERLESQNQFLGETRLGTVMYSRHCKGGAYDGSFRYWMENETIIVLYDFSCEEKFSVDLAQPDSFQLASDFIRKLWDRQQSSRLPIDGPRWRNK